MNELNSSTLATPTGPLTILTGPDGRVRAAGFTADIEPLLAVVHPSLRAPVRPRADLGAVTVAVRSYLDGELTAIDEVPVEQYTGGEFMTHAWQTLREVKPGEPVTYTGFAELAGRPRAVRAARRPAPATPPRSSSRATGCCAPTAAWAGSAGVGGEEVAARS